MQKTFVFEFLRPSSCHREDKALRACLDRLGDRPQPLGALSDRPTDKEQLRSRRGDVGESRSPSQGLNLAIAYQVNKRMMEVGEAVA
jgi:hypothetical protein